MPTRFQFFAPVPRGTEKLLAAELRGLGAASVRPGRAGVAFTGPLEAGYRACLWSRTASRVLLQLARLDAASADALYASVRAFPWEEHVGADGTIAVDFIGTSPEIRHTRFGALRVKDAIVDRFRELAGTRPSVDTERPDLRIHARLDRGRLTLSVDLAGQPLHRRGYRTSGGRAPLKENLAAAILMAAGWPEAAQRGESFVDPMCGSGTLPIEAALIAGDVAPGLRRTYFGFSGWGGHDPELWARLCDEAERRRDDGAANIPPIEGFDADAKVLEAARANAGAAGVADNIRFEHRDVGECEAHEGQGLLVVNPPYGERVGDKSALPTLYHRLLDGLRQCYPSWRTAVFTADSHFVGHTGIEATNLGPLFNGPLRCDLWAFDVSAGEGAAATDPGREMFANRLRKDLKQIGRWARREGVHCFRVYDADIPEYAVAVDLYEGPQRWAHVQEYAPPASVDPSRAAARRESVRNTVPAILDLPPEHCFFKVRQRQKGTRQYGRMADVGRFQEVWESGARLLVNFTDYLDTGLFLDHRSTRLMLRELAAGRRFLNLFAYTATATVHAALGGAASSLSVDMSATYTEWAQRNFDLNGLDPKRHRLLQTDCLQWLERKQSERFDLVFVDPPTFSNSKRMAGPFDVIRDHVWLIERAAELLSDDGILIFSNNARGFRMEAGALPHLHVEDITRSTLPRDFERNPKIHNCWRITRRSS